MDKQTTVQVAKALNIIPQRLHAILHHYPHLRPGEQAGAAVHYLYLWSEAEIAALRAHIAAHPFRRRKRTE